MKIKELQKTVNIAWSPAQQQQIFLAAGTAAQQFDSNANSTLEIYSPNFSDATYDLELKASVASQHKFQKLIWSPIGPHPSGLIVGGCEAGQINIYSAGKLLANGNEEPLLARQDKHTGAVTGLDFNPFQNNLLASCASESEIYIWDLNNPATHMNPGAKTQPLEDVKNVAWNRQVQHILASVFSTRCVIWDLRKSQQIIKLSDSQSRVRWHAIEWHPEAATQVWLASEDDQAPVVQLWDLRYATAPAKTYQIHERGVLGMSWCLQDNDLMVSCGKDNRIYCWNPNTKVPEGEILSEVATTSSWYSDVQFCPRNPALIASASLEGAVSIYSLHGGTHHLVQTANKIADSFPGMDQFAQEPIPQQATQVVYHDLTHAPKWMKRPCGVAFGFGGKLVSFDGVSKKVKVSQLTTEAALVERANALERSLADANYADYCRQRADDTPDQHRRYLWYFIKANFELNPKEEMLNLLGYNKDDIDSKFNKFIKETETNSQSDVDTLTTRISTLTHSDSSEVECDQSTNYSTDNSATLDNKFDGNGTDSQNHDYATLSRRPQFKVPSGDHSDSLIAEAILTGNIEAAVELCLEAQRIPEALIIASTAGIDTLTRTQTRYLGQQKSELSHVISALVTRDWLDFVNRCTVESWKEALVAALKHSERKVVDICERLGDRLLNECANSVESTRNAMLCYICAGSIDKLVSAWYQLKQLEQQSHSYKLNTTELQDLAEVVMLMCKSLEQQGISVDLAGRFAGFLTEYGGLLASQGALTAALQYITTLGGGATCENEVLHGLRDRINNAVNLEQTQPQAAAAAAPAFGYPGPQQRGRGSFSQQHPVASMSYGQPANQYGNPANNGWPSPAPPAPATYPAAQPAPQIFNPQQVKQEPAAHPPRPLSNASSSGGPPPSSSGPSGGLGVHARSKYVLDPSVAAPTSAYGMPYNPVPAPAPSAAPFTGGPGPGALPQAANVPTYNSNAFNTNPLSSGQGYNPTPFAGAQQNSYLPGVNPIETMPPAAQPPIIQNVQRNPTPPPGWNDPPALKSSRAPKPKPVAEPSAAPIFHPIFPVDPNQNQNGYMDPAQYQNAPPPGVASNAYYNPVAFNNNPQQQQSYLQPQQQGIPNQAPPQQQNWQGQQQQQQNIGYTEQPAPIQQQQRQPEVPKEKPPLPEEYIYLQTVLEELKNRCLSATNDPRTKRKFVDVVKRLENLYDCLRDGKLTPTTVQYLNQIIQYIQISDYANALEVHTRIAFGTDFAQCAGFMQGLKVLLQSASEMQLVLR
ncbi:LOW QUALITY PROTEIN: protein transport protein Sec31A [Drosophila subobscura]|uniref:LOW QUALITY PROTEIN: protein transport protein Sec31A n=1 Tax=Drosophila subobscura TaxID=7241 RepID=UPI00155AC531|nr:LOW QUALITY PROTEIN: protein transport protein Sec31A [Drosophila subobscura]